MVQARRKRKKKRKNRRNQGLELSYLLVWKLYVYGYYKYGTHFYGIHVWNTCIETISNLSLSKLCRKNPNRNVIGWYKMSFVAYFELVLVWKEISCENG